MNATIELIKAKQNAVRAEEDLKKAKQRADQEARIRVFAPIKQLIEEVADLPAKEKSEWPIISIRPKDPYLVGAWIHRDAIISVEIMARYSGKLRVSSHEDGSFDLDYGYSCRDNRKNVTLEDAKNALIERLAMLAK
jgi:hypothetical protein